MQERTRFGRAERPAIREESWHALRMCRRSGPEQEAAIRAGTEISPL